MLLLAQLNQKLLRKQVPEKRVTIGVKIDGKKDAVMK
jgi:hypothetical protein